MWAGIAHLRQISPRSRYAIAVVDSTQVARRISIEEMSVRIGRDLRHSLHDHRRRELHFLAASTT
jgi:hypothetical protein